MSCSTALGTALWRRWSGCWSAPPAISPARTGAPRPRSKRFDLGAAQAALLAPGEYLIGDYHLAYDVRMPTRERPLRTDAVRNAGRIIASAQRVFASAGPQAAMEDIAAEAGVGVATVYRRFPTKDALLRVVLDRRFDEVVGAALESAQHEVDARDALRAALRGAVSFIAGDPNTMAMSSGLMTMDLAYRFFEPVAAIVRRGQDD